MHPKTRRSARLASTGASFVLVGAALLMATPAAHANSAASIEGARATFVSQDEVFRLYDTSCDGNPVFLDYTVQGNRHRIDYSGGCGTHGTYNLAIPENQRITYKACVNIRHGSDRCSGSSADVT